jgi:hypothetical protein
MLRTLNLTAEFLECPAKIVLVTSTTRHSKLPSVADLRNSGIFGIWRDRSHIGDSTDFSRHLRSEG